MAIFENPQQALFKQEDEKNKLEKLLNQGEIRRLKELLSKPILNLSEVSEIQATLSAQFIRLSKFEKKEKYLHFKLYIQISKFAGRYGKAIMNDSKIEADLLTNNKLNATEKMEIQEIRKDIQKEYSNIYKNFVNGLLFGMNSGLSVNGYLIEELNKDKKDYTYTGVNPVPNNEVQNK